MLEALKALEALELLPLQDAFSIFLWYVLHCYWILEPLGPLKAADAAGDAAAASIP